MVALVASSWCMAAPFAPAQPPTDPAKLLTVAANGYRANLESFEYVTCKYTVTWGFAKSLDDAIAGRLEPGSRTATAAYYKDGRTVRYRIDEDAATKATLDKPAKPEKMAEAPGLKGGALVPFMTMDYLLTASHGLGYDPRGRTANYYDGESEKAKEVGPYFLLSMLQVNTKYDFGLLADRSTRGEIRSVPEAAMREGEFKTIFHFAQDPTVTFTVDLTRGSLPVRMERKYKNGEEGISTVVVPQIRACSKGRWFPERVVTHMKQFPAQSPCLVKVFEVTELDVDRRPAADLLKLDLPAGTVVNYFTGSQNYFKTRQQEKVGPDDLGRIQKLLEDVPQNPQMDTTIVQPRSYTWVWYVVAGVVGLLVVAYLVRRYRAAQGQHAPA